jgi:PAS domain S-box-containing protein
VPNESRVEDELKFLTSVIDAIPDPVFVKNRQHQFVAVNTALCRFIGRPRDELLGKSDFDFFPKSQAETFWAHDDLVFDQDTVDENEEPITNAQGEQHIISTRKAAFWDANGRQVLVGIIRDVTAQKRSEGILKAATQAKSDFVAHMSHELRTPLNGILGMVELMRRLELSGVAREHLDVIHGSAEALLGVLNDVLDYSKIEAGALVIESHEFDPVTLIEDACAVFGAAAARKGVELVVLVDDSMPARVRCDPTRVRQIVMNLVSNAVKFTSFGEVIVEASTRGDDLEISVTDTGIGMSAEVIARLFSPFAQGDSSVTRRFGGTGLGLNISQRLARLMGGAVRATSTPGRGSCFTFVCPAHVVEQARTSMRWLKDVSVLVVDDHPIARQALVRHLERLGARVRAAAGVADASAALLEQPFDVVVSEDSRIAALRPVLGTAGVIGTGGAGTPEGAALHLVKPVRRDRLEALLHEIAAGKAPDAPDHARFQGRVLVVEDNPVNQRVLVLLLQSAGLQAVVAEDGRRAIERLEKEPFDVVLMDLQMPELDGAEATRRIRATPGVLSTVPIIAVTAHALAPETERCMEAGMNAVLRKPVRREELLATLSQFVPRASGA